jgi:hypothetical protein
MAHHEFACRICEAPRVTFSTPEQGDQDGDARGCSVGLNARFHA